MTNIKNFMEHPVLPDNHLYTSLSNQFLHHVTSNLVKIREAVSSSYNMIKKISVTCT